VHAEIGADIDERRRHAVCLDDILVCVDNLGVMPQHRYRVDPIELRTFRAHRNQRALAKEVDGSVPLFEIVRTIPKSAPDE
jgi:hypothetical protein